MRVQVINGRCVVNSVWQSPASPRIFGVINFAVKYVIPLCLFTFCYTKMLLSLHGRRRRSRLKRRAPANRAATVIAQTVKPSSTTCATGPGTGDTGGPVASQHHEEQFLKAKYNIFKAVLCIVIAHMFCWSTEKVVMFLIYFGDKSAITAAARTWGEVLVYASCSINPLVLAATYAEFQRTVRANCLRLHNFVSAPNTWL